MARSPAKNQPVEPTALPSKRRVGRHTYLYAVGRRKSSVARCRYYRKGEGKILINHQPVEQYFPYERYRQICLAPLQVAGLTLAGDLTVKVEGGGVRGQAEAVRLGVARLLVKLDRGYRLALKKAGFLKRDPRVKERKKYGLKRARRAPQWQKR